MMNLKPYFVSCFICLLSLLTSSNINAAVKPPGSFFFQETFGDFQDELVTAKEEGKRAILIFFEMDECPFCHRMKTSILNQTDVQAYFRKHFRIFSLDIEGDLEMTDFKGTSISQKDFAFKQHRVRATPVIAFFDLDGKKIMNYTGATGSKEEFILLGKFVAEGHYKKTRFTRFKREQKQ